MTCRSVQVTPIPRDIIGFPAAVVLRDILSDRSKECYIMCIWYTLLKTNILNSKMEVVCLDDFSFSKGGFSGSMLVFG